LIDAAFAHWPEKGMFDNPKHLRSWLAWRAGWVHTEELPATADPHLTATILEAQFRHARAQGIYVFVTVTDEAVYVHHPKTLQKAVVRSPEFREYAERIYGLLCHHLSLNNIDDLKREAKQIVEDRRAAAARKKKGTSCAHSEA
jgi:hypothetical protein